MAGNAHDHYCANNLVVPKDVGCVDMTMSGMADATRLPELALPAMNRQPALLLRPWLPDDMPDVLAAMALEDPEGDPFKGGPWGPS
jgi:hypothetical protein